MANIISNLFDKLKMAQVGNKLADQEKQELINAGNQAFSKQKNITATPEEASLLNQELQKINEQNGIQGDDFTLPTMEKQKKSNLADYLFGQRITTPSTVNVEGDAQNPTINISTSNDLRQGGLFNDVANGFRENSSQAFSPENLQNNLTDDGRNKGFAYRFGEGLGSTVGFLDSPAGRMLMAYAGSSAIGDTNPMEQAITAGVTNKNLRDNDKIYRRSLNDLGIDTDGIRGFINKDVYNGIALNSYRKNSLDTKQAIANQKDDTQRAKLIETLLNNGMIEPKEAMVRMAEYGIPLESLSQSNQTQLLPYKKYALQVAPQVALGTLELGQARLQEQIEQDNFNNALKMEEFNEKKNKEQVKANKNLSTINMIQKAIKTVKENLNAFGIKGGLGASVINRLDPKGVKARSVINSVTAEYRKYLTGAQMSDQERKEYYKFLPSPTDNAQIIISKLNSMLDVISAREGMDAPSANNSNKVTTVGKYKVTVK